MRARFIIIACLLIVCSCSKAPVKPMAVTTGLGFRIAGHVETEVEYRGIPGPTYITLWKSPDVGYRKLVNSDGSWAFQIGGVPDGDIVLEVEPEIGWACTRWEYPNWLVNVRAEGCTLRFRVPIPTVHTVGGGVDQIFCIIKSVQEVTKTAWLPTRQVTPEPTPDLVITQVLYPTHTPRPTHTPTAKATVTATRTKTPWAPPTWPCLPSGTAVETATVTRTPGAVIGFQQFSGAERHRIIEAGMLASPSEPNYLDSKSGRIGAEYLTMFPRTCEYTVLGDAGKALSCRMFPNGVYVERSEGTPDPLRLEFGFVCPDLQQNWEGEAL